MNIEEYSWVLQHASKMIPITEQIKCLKIKDMQNIFAIRYNGTIQLLKFIDYKEKSTDRIRIIGKTPIPVNSDLTIGELIRIVKSDY